MWSCGLCCQVAFSRLTIPQCMVISLDYLEFRKDELTPGFRECLCVDRLAGGWGRGGVGGLISHVFSSFCVPSSCKRMCVQSFHSRHSKCEAGATSLI